MYNEITLQLWQYVLGTKICPRYRPFMWRIHRWIPRTNASDAELWCFLWSTPEQMVEKNNRDAGDFRRHRAHYDVIVMITASMSEYIQEHCTVINTAFTVIQLPVKVPMVFPYDRKKNMCYCCWGRLKLLQRLSKFRYHLGWYHWRMNQPGRHVRTIIPTIYIYECNGPPETYLSAAE